MLDDMNILEQRDPGNTRGFAALMANQTAYEVAVEPGAPVTEQVHQIVLAGMGGSALAADMISVLTTGWLHVPLQVVKGYELPGFVGKNTLVIATSHSGNTEETLACYQQARQAGCMVGVMTTGGQLLEQAMADNLPYVQLPSGGQPRMSTMYHLRGLLKLLQHFYVIDNHLYDEMEDNTTWLDSHLLRWTPEVPEHENGAKRLALALAGKTAVFYGGELTWPLAYKWKISLNESAKNMAFWNRYPEFSHNEFVGWSSHPVDKPFAVVDFRSSLERPRIRPRMEITDQLLSGMRPKAIVVELQGETLMQQLLWGMALADITSIYLAVLNNVNPEPVALVEKLKQELAAL